MTTAIMRGLVWLTPELSAAPAAHLASNADGSGRINLMCGLSVTGGELVDGDEARTRSPRWCPACLSARYSGGGR